jgi:hypothetical protein
MTQTKRHPGLPGWGLGLRLATLSRRELTVQKPVLKPRKDGTIDDGHSTKQTNEIRIPTWNIHTMYIPGRLQETAEEVLKYKIDTVAVQEIRWQGTEKIDKPNYTFYYGGTKERTI